MRKIGWPSRVEGELALTGWVSSRDGGSALGWVGLKTVGCQCLPALGGTKLAWNGRR